MKKLLAAFLMLALVVSFSACSNENANENSSEQSSKPIVSENSKEKDKETADISSKESETTSKQTTTSRESTTTSKPKPASSSSSKKPTLSSAENSSFNENIINSKPILPFSSEPSTGTHRFTNAEEMCNAPELKAQIEQLNELFKEIGLKISIEGEGDKISFVYTFLEQQDAELLKTPLEEALKSQKDTFNLQVEQMQTAVENKMILGIKYVNADGTVICEAEFPQ